VDIANLTDQEVIKYGEAIEELKPTVAYQLIIELLENFDRKIGERGLRDDSHTREWWVAQQDAFRLIRDTLEKLPAHAAQLKNELEQQSEIALPSRQGAGDLA